MKRISISIGVCLLVLAVGGLVLGKDDKTAPGPLSGSWEGIAHAPDGDEAFTMALEQSEESVKGSISTSNGGQLEITSGSYKNNMLEIHCETPDAKHHVTGKLAAGQLSGEWSKDGDNDKGTWEAKKSDQAKPTTP